MTMRTALLLTLTAVGLCGGGLPQARPFYPAPKDHPGPGAAVRRERIAAQLHTLRSQRLQQSLGVSEEKARTIADRWARFDEDSFGRRQQMVALRQQVNSALVAPGSEEEKNRKLQPVVDQLAVLRQQQQEARKRFEDDICATLTPAQQGRFILVVEEIQRSIQDAIQERRRERP